MAASPPARLHPALAGGLLLASGAGALVVEMTWMRWFRDLFGATAPAASATLVAFFAGHALGAAWASRRLQRAESALRLYGALEFCACGLGLLVPVVLHGFELALGPVYDALRTGPSIGLAAVRFTGALVATLPAAACYGATWPVLSHALSPDPASMGSRAGGLYGLNTLGAVVGTAAAAFWLPPWVGIPATYGVGLVLAAGTGAVALFAARRTGAETESKSAPQKPRTDAVPIERGDLPWLGLAALSGFGAFAAQVLLVQAFGLVLNQSVLAFGAVLVAVLTALAASALGVARLVRRTDSDVTGWLGLALAVAALAWLGFPRVLHGSTDGLAYFGTETAGGGYVVGAIVAVFRAAGPALLAAGAIFPLVIAQAGQAGGRARAGVRLGRLAAANTAGAILGALAAPYALLPWLGPWGAFVAVSLAYALPAVFLRDPVPARRWLRDGSLAVGWVAIATTASPLALPHTPVAAGERLLYQAADASGVVSVLERRGERRIRTDNHYSLGGTAERVHHERQGHLPLVLHTKARRVAYVGSATGISAGAVTQHPVESIALVELVPLVARAAETYFGRFNRSVYTDPRTEVVLDDARNFLAHTEARFDVVVADLFVPWRAGTGALYTREHFENVRVRLAPGGLFCQWLPLYQLSPGEFAVIAATFADVFPKSAVFRGDFFGAYPTAALVGFQSEPAAIAAIEAATTRLGVAGGEDRWVTDPAGPFSLYVGPLSAARLDDVSRNTAAQPVIEYRAARSHAGGARAKSERMTGAQWIAWSRRLREAAAADPAGVFPDLGGAQQRASEGGLALQQAGALYTENRVPEAARTLERAAALLPARLVRDAPADATAAELWFDR
ncbi:MAG: fused MFS/spermidine synthase [Proteobacteria bacterium]|nr:fused MFS/spermidine synthase [Pseudomonadota bacterium]